MTEDILINITPQETRVALVVQGAVQELHIERTLTRGLAGNVYSGKVVRVLPGMQSAFIDIGLERAAFLHVADIWEARPARRQQWQAPAAPTPIEKLLFDGQVLTVQVIKDPIGTKGARLSTQISIAGRMLVYLPQDKHIGISQKIEKESEREALRARMKACCRPRKKAATSCAPRPRKRPTPTSPPTSTTCARPGRDHQGRAHPPRHQPAVPGPEPGPARAARLRARRDRGDPGRLARELSDAGRIRPGLHPERAVAPAALHRRAAAVRPVRRRGRDPARAGPARRPEVGRLPDRRPDRGDDHHRREHGRLRRRAQFRDTIFKTNLEAAHAIARQLRLRNLGGIIILDFIDMENAEHRNAVLAELKKTCRATAPRCR
jgi:ribonuclease G